jgi:hypothetical protein
MAKEGYLVYHEGVADGRRASQIYYCALGEGKLQFYSKRDSGVLVKNVELTKSKLKIRGVPDHEARQCPFSFTVVVHHSKIVEGRQVVYGKPSQLLLSAPSWAERKSWGNAIHSWQRNYWGEPEHRQSIKDEAAVELFFDEQRRTLESAVERAQSSTTSSSSVSSSTESTTPTHSSSSTSSSSGRKSFFSRAPSIKKMGSNMRKKISSASVTISLPPMSINITSSLQQLRPQQQQPQQPVAVAPAH